MNAGALVATIFGGTVLFVGFVFWLITRFMQNDHDRRVTGQVVDITADADAFNAQQGFVAPKRRLTVYVSTNSRTRHSSVHKVYTYTVGTQTYTRADRVAYSRGLAMAAIGKEAVVTYDSADPGNSALLSGTAFTIVYRILFAVGGALLLLAAWLWLR